MKALADTESQHLRTNTYASMNSSLYLPLRLITPNSHFPRWMSIYTLLLELAEHLMKLRNTLYHLHYWRV